MADNQIVLTLGLIRQRAVRNFRAVNSCLAALEPAAEA